MMERMNSENERAQSTPSAKPLRVIKLRREDDSAKRARGLAVKRTHSCIVRGLILDQVMWFVQD